jgi:hypothetical protein
MARCPGALDHHDGAVRCRGPTTPGEDLAGVVVVPVVQDVAQEVGVGPNGQRVEEAAGDGAGPIVESGCRESVGRSGCRRG